MDTGNIIVVEGWREEGEEKKEGRKGFGKMIGGDVG